MVTRRGFIKLTGLAACTAFTGTSDAGDVKEPLPDSTGMLTDISLCVGCRSCEAACNEINGLPSPERPFDDLSVLDNARRMDINAYTVVNRYKSEKRRGEAVNVKIQCMHCVDPACVSACLVKSLQKTQEGPVIWEAWRCMGCRYCMVACPFGVPAYEYDKGIEPRVMKCTMCHPLVKQGKAPVCAQACPQQAITFGPRAKLIEIAKERIKKNPDRYVDHIYGEHEVGGTAWLFLAPQSFSSLDFLDLPDNAPPRLSEAIQHGVFKHFIPPVLLFSGLGALMYATRGKDSHEEKVNGDVSNEEGETGSNPSSASKEEKDSSGSDGANQ